MICTYIYLYVKNLQMLISVTNIFNHKNTLLHQAYDVFNIYRYLVVMFCICGFMYIYKVIHIIMFIIIIHYISNIDVMLTYFYKKL